MIVAGYPGVGKSSCGMGKNFPYVTHDLESSYYPKDEGWEKQYCEFAKSINQDKAIIFVSTHSQVLDYFQKTNTDIVLCYPDFHLERKWVKKLENRNLEEKHRRAYARAKDCYLKDIMGLRNRKSPHITHARIISMDYSLKEIIKSLLT